jgi:hypothetical protein
MPRKRPGSDDWFTCPHCGAELPQGARFCRQCGASDDSGWGDPQEDSEDDFDYDEFVRQEFPEQVPLSSRYPPRRLLVGLVIVLLCLALLAWTLGPIW